MPSRRTVIWALVLLAFLGFGYAKVNPAFAARCEAAYATYVRPVYTACKSWVAPHVGAISRALARPTTQPAKRTSVSPSWQERSDRQWDSPPPETRSDLSPGERIAKGHAFPKHRDQFKFSKREQMASHVDRVISFSGSSDTKQLRNGRVAYWDTFSGSVVIVDPNTADGGTTFKPSRGRAYFESLK